MYQINKDLANSAFKIVLWVFGIITFTNIVFWLSVVFIYWYKIKKDELLLELIEEWSYRFAKLYWLPVILVIAVACYLVCSGIYHLCKKK